MIPLLFIYIADGQNKSSNATIMADKELLQPS